MHKWILTAAATLVLFTLMPPQAAPAQAVCDKMKSCSQSVTVNNKSDRCAWVTIYWQGVLNTHWTIASNPRPRFVKPNEILSMRDHKSQRLKVRAEVMHSASCSGGRQHDVYFETNLVRDGLVLRRNPSGNYQITRG